MSALKHQASATGSANFTITPPSGTAVDRTLTLPDATGTLAVQTNMVIDRAYAEYTANTDITTIIPADDTIPQNTEGTQILSVSITPKSATNRVRLRFQCEGANNTASGILAAMFSSESANALRATLVSVTSAGASQQLVLEHEYVPGVTSALTFSVRVGPSSGTVRLNGNTSGRLLGGSVAATLVVEEIAA